MERTRAALDRDRAALERGCATIERDCAALEWTPAALEWACAVLELGTAHFNDTDDADGLCDSRVDWRRIPFERVRARSDYAAVTFRVRAFTAQGVPVWPAIVPAWPALVATHTGSARCLAGGRRSLRGSGGDKIFLFTSNERDAQGQGSRHPAAQASTPIAACERICALLALMLFVLYAGPSAVNCQLVTQSCDAGRRQRVINYPRVQRARPPLALSDRWESLIHRPGSLAIVGTLPRIVERAEQKFAASGWEAHLRTLPANSRKAFAANASAQFAGKADLGFAGKADFRFAAKHIWQTMKRHVSVQVHSQCGYSERWAARCGSKAGDPFAGKAGDPFASKCRG